MSNTIKSKVIPVILCGGFGTRLWPLSREKAPKQFHSIATEETLFHDTLSRAMTCTGIKADEIVTVTADSIKKETVHQLANFNPDSIAHLLSEPSARNTAAAVAYAALHVHDAFGPETVLWILPADHHVENDAALQSALEKATTAAQDGYIVTFGMKPTRPETGYGYIKSGAAIGDTMVQTVAEFVEKPDQDIAEQYVQNGQYLWNSGMFVATAKTLLDSFIEYSADIVGPLNNAMKNKDVSMAETYKSLPAVPFDVAIMEKTNKAAVVACDIGWSDVGSWESVWELKNKDANGNVIGGRVAAVDSENCLIQSNNLLVATMGLKDIVVIENSDSILVADKKNGKAMKKIVQTLKDMDSPEAINPPMETRPWGQFRVLSESEGYKVKEIIVTPGGKLSSQMHHHRCEFWTVISGEAVVTIDDKEIILKAQQNAFIPLKATHRLENASDEDLVMVEVQCGNYLGEDDIVRFDDIYGRAEEAA
jgi:mannose-1-phosphate guanylyltransferase/mannose-6-phosphate isomerase